MRLRQLIVLAIAIFSGIANPVSSAVATNNVGKEAAVTHENTATGQVPPSDMARFEKLVVDSKLSGEAAFNTLGYSYSFSVGQNTKSQPHLWRWASVTKQVIAVLVMQEVAKGTIELDQPLNRYAPQFKSPNAAKITVRQLLRHQSGLPNPDDTATSATEIAAFYTPDYNGNRDPLSGYCAGTPKAEPGGNWSYNNCDYMVAGALLKAVTGKSWQQLVRDRIIKPLRLKSVGFYPTKAPTVIGTVKNAPEPKIDFGAFGSAAGMYGTPADLLRFDAALADGRLLGKKQLDEMWDGQADLGYIALGQWVFDASLKDCAKPVKIVERRGAVGGVQIRNFIIPERHAALVVFSDQSADDFDFGEIWQGSGVSHDLLNAALCSVETK
jgi:D-alanyl-D-alanine carboxypeptidase